jgi:hypothetical protein
LPVTINAALAAKIQSDIDKRLDNDSPTAQISAYLGGDHRLPYMPKRAQMEYTIIAKNCIDNWLPLVSNTFTKRLFVEGYRPSGSTANTAPWDFWQANKLDARQGITHRGAIEYGKSYVLVLPGTLNNKPTPLIQPLSPLRSIAYFSDEDDEYPYLAARSLNDRADGTQVLEVFDASNVYTFLMATEDTVAIPGTEGIFDPVPQKVWTLSQTQAHGLGVAPFVRFRESLGDRHHGAIYPLLRDQDRINEITFSIHMALQYGVFRQRWATGLAIPVDDNGNAVEPFQAAIDRLWVSEDPDTKFGEFSQLDLTGHMSAYGNAVKTFAAHAQIDPNLLTGDVINVSAEALGSMKDATTEQLDEYKVIFGEAWEQVFRLAAKAAGDPTNADDMSAQVRWGDDTSREFLTTVQGLGTLVTQLDVPAKALWPKIPGMTDQDLQDMYEEAEKQANDPMTALLANLEKQATSPQLPPKPGEPAPPQNGVTPNGFTAQQPAPAVA